VKPHPEGGTHVPELTVVPVTCMQARPLALQPQTPSITTTNPQHFNHNPLTPLSQDVQRLMDKGKANRSVGATCMNEHSSRSHCILSVYVCSSPCFNAFL